MGSPLTGEHRVGGVANQDKSVLVPFGNRLSGDQFPELHIAGFSAPCVKYVMCISHGQTDLTAVCRAGAKCFLAYSTGTLGDTIARKSTFSISDGPLVDLQDWLVPTFSNVGSVKLP